MSDIVEQLRDMFVRFGGESNDDAATRRVKTAKEAADEIEKLRAERDALKARIDAINKERAERYYFRHECEGEDHGQV